MGGTIKTYTSATRNTYDHRGRLTLTEKKINNAAAWKRISTETYDALGQLKTKQLGSDPLITTNPLETLNYDYNIRGWLLGVNRDYAKTVSSTSNYFGFDLGYDKTDIKPTSGSSIGAFANAAYNGNIGGMLWKSTGDDQVRKYDFTYDAVNRLQVANFKQYGSTTNVFDVSDNIDYTVSNLSYDANGNIKTMQQNGWKFGGSATIDNLTYKYFNDNSNKLQNVIDGNSDAATKLGDFRYSTAYTALLGGTKLNTVTDYGYDVNGNLTADKNKDITGINYNYLNLPSIITVTGKGSIEYIYDATGNKLKKIVHETAKPDKTTLYLFGTYQDDILQFLPQEEGRIRFIPATTSFAFDYFIKDHLGNVRMVLTDEQQAPDQYPIVTFEDANLTNEQLYYENVDVQRTAAPAGLNASTGNGAKVQLLRKSTNSIGAGKLLRVMATDKIEVMVDYYIPTATTDNSAANGVNSIVSSLLGILNGATAPALLKGNGSTITNGLNSSAPFTSFLQPQNAAVPDGQPKAYLNVIFFDDQFKFVQQNSQFFPANVSGSKQQIIKINTDAAVAVKNGYVYIYVSNESNNLVYFDNLAVTQKRGAILEETHYYPFGLPMAGISSKAAGKLENRKKYQQYEWNTDFDADIYETYYRTYDPQIGRFLQIDPSPKDFESLYVSMGNNPVSNVDPRGDNWWDIVAATLISIVDNTVAGSNLRESYKPADPADFNNALRSADASMLTVGAAMMVDGTRNMGGGAVLLAAGGAGVPVIIAGALEMGVGADISINATLNISKGYNYGIDQEAMQRGRDNETKALKEEELKKNTKPESVTDPKTEKKVTTIPDSYTDQKATVDVKDTKKVNYTKQLRAQEVISKKNGQKPVIITGPNTKVSTTVDKKFTIVTKPYLGPQ